MRICVLFVIIVLFNLNVVAQQTTYLITGTVKNQKGIVIENAHIYMAVNMGKV